MEVARPVQAPIMFFECRSSQHCEQIDYHIVVQRWQQMRSFDQQRSALALRALNTRDYRRPQPLCLGNDIGHRLLRAEGKAMKLKAVFFTMLTLDDLANKSCPDSMVETEAPG